MKRTESHPGTPEVSVVIATYNMGQYVAEAVESVLAQTRPSLEVIVVDDGSTDDTQSRLERFNTDPRVVVLSQENSGQAKAKNAGLLRSKGRFLAFCDADDLWLPDKLERQLPLFEQNPGTGVVYSRAIALCSDGSREEFQTPSCVRGDVLHAMFVRNIVPFGTAVVRRECLFETGLFDESLAMGIDWDLWLRVAVKWEFDFVPEPTYVYRVWDGQMSNNWRGRYEYALRIMASFLATHRERLPSGIVSLAYADTYTNLAAEELHHVGVRACTRTLWSALKHKPGFWPAWRLLLLMPWHRLQAIRA